MINRKRSPLKGEWLIRARAIITFKAALIIKGG